MVYEYGFKIALAPICGKKWENCWAWNNWFNRFNFIASGHERSWAVPMIRLLLRGYFVANLSTLMLFSLDKLWSVSEESMIVKFSVSIFWQIFLVKRNESRKRAERQKATSSIFPIGILLYFRRNLQSVTFFIFSDQEIIFNKPRKGIWSELMKKSAVIWLFWNKGKKTFLTFLISKSR